MIKRILTALLIAVTFVLAGCDDKTENQDSKKIVVGVAAGPYGDMFKDAIAPGLTEKGYQVEIKEFSDYIQPNLALANKEIDINLFQHLSYLNYFKSVHNLDLTAVAFVPTAGAGIYSSKISSLDELKAGDEVTIANDPTNEARALRILQAAGLITLSPDADVNNATPKDIVDNPIGLKFIPIEAPQTPRSLDSAVISVVNGNYAIGAGLDLSKALYTEVLEPNLKNVVVIRTTSVNEQLGEDVLDVMKSAAYQGIIDNTDYIYHTFQKPNYQLYQ